MKAKLAIKKLNTSDDFLTPPELVEAMGLFDLDPCSSHRQERPLARHCYRFPEDNGLLLPWHGSVFVNPPFSELKSWVERFIVHADGVMLCPARVEVAWFWKLWSHCDGIFFSKGPIKYLCPNGSAPPRFFRRRVLRDRQRQRATATQYSAQRCDCYRKDDEEIRMSNFPLPYSSIKRSTKPIRPRKKAQVRVGKVTGKIRLSGQALTELRERVYRRDQGRCQWRGCGALLPLYGSVFTRAHLAHIQSRGASGSDTEANTRILCYTHHMQEHTEGRISD